MNQVEGIGFSAGGTDDPRVFIANIVRYVLTFVGLVAVIFIIYGGWLWMTSAGNPERVNRAKRTLIGAAIGLFIIIAAFAIVTMVINIFDEVSNLGCDPPCGDGFFCCNGTCCADGMYCCATGCSATPCTSGTIPIGNTFRLTDVSPIGANVIRNARIRLNFNRVVEPTTVDNTTVRVFSDGTEIFGDLDVGGTRVQFTPTGDCGPNDCDATGCFAAGSNIEVRVFGVESTDGLLLEEMIDPYTTIITSCGSGMLGNCAYDFDVGALIDCENPFVALDINQVCQAPDNELYALSSDDSGVYDLTFFVDDGSGEVEVGSVLNPGGDPFNTRPLAMPVLWDGTSAVSPTVNIRVVAQDLDDHTSQRNSNYTLRPEHCCNGLLDTAEGELGIDCGGPCAACDGAACGISLVDDCSFDLDSDGNPDIDCHDNDDRCAGRFCDCQAPVGVTCQDIGYAAGVNDCCVCQSPPVVDWITPQGGFCRDGADAPTNTPCLNDDDCASLPGYCDLSTANGAAGNLVTIGGRHFGDTPGTVDFAGTVANLADTINPACVNSWSDRQIVVEVPGGLPDLNEVAVTVTEGVTGNDYQGTYFGFLANSIIRPGLCDLNPTEGVINTLLNYEGAGLNGVDAYFGNLRAYVPAFNSIFAVNTSGTAQVSNLENGRTSTFVLRGNVASNFLNFIKLPEPYTGPTITSFEPASGNVGQYVTIYGSGFGASRGASAVYFDDGGGTMIEVDYDFPEICQNSVWTDNEVIVKVPAAAAANYTIVMDIAGEPELIDTSELDPPQFTLDLGADLLPSLCRIAPRMAPNEAPVSLWGEYFGVSTPGLVRFQLNQDQLGGSWYVEDDADRIDTIVNMDAVSGPVRVVDSGGNEGNGLNLMVGFCTDAPDPDAACGGFCCPGTSYRAGRCASDDPMLGGNNDGAVDIQDCFMQIEASVYEWTFDTTGLAGLGEPCNNISTENTCTDATLPECDPALGLICDYDAGCICQPDASADSCQGLSRNLGACLAGFCPNAAGQCSPLAGEMEPLGLACTDAACNSAYPECAGNCNYNADINRCYDTTQGDCSLDQTFPDVLGRPRAGYCADYGGVGRWHINTTLSCPGGWRMLMGNVCVDEAAPCQNCATGWNCRDDEDGDTEGLCVIDEDICPSRSECVGGECQRDNSQCECCCEIGEDERDCCAYEDPVGSGTFVQLTCEGTCGDDAIDDGAGWGHCTGCADAPNPDEACNCSGSTGRYCEINSEYPEGICRDCAQLSDPDSCSGHPSTCCVDADRSDDCRGGAGTTPGNINPWGYTMTAPGGNPAYAYCSYYECEAASGNCSIDLGEAVASSTNPASPLFTSTTTCAADCAGSGLGAGESCHDPMTDSCTLICGAGYDCIGETGCSGSACPPDDETCACCCNPLADECNLISPSLVCEPDLSPCDGGSRGLCCGCEIDLDCVAGGSPVSVGCGLDSCCRPRPMVIQPTIPPDDGTEICRNAVIEAEFDQLMNSGSFSSNMVVVGDYGADPCPEGTQYLAAEGFDMRKNWFERIGMNIYNKISRFLPGRIAEAFSNVFADRNYCAIPGAVSGYNNAAGHTVISFAPGRLMDPLRLHYAIIKGDDNLNDNIQEGVLNAWGIGLNASLNSPSAGDNTFNGITYQNAYIWSFTTMDEQAANNGVCTLDAVRIEPRSYLYTTTEDNLNDEVDNNPLDPTYDSVRDADKEFRSRAISGRNQVIVPVPGYTWDWTWAIADPLLVDFDPVSTLPANGTERLLEAQGGRVDGRTQVSATINIIDDVNGYGGDGLNAAADLYVFLCDNPWPPIAFDGTWAPWSDSNTNCTEPLNGCRNTNYELYYCRDTGRNGTFDDLPAIASDNVVVRGESDLSCSIQPGDCSTAGLGDPCGPLNRGVCQHLLKETFYLREVGPTLSTSLTVDNTGEGRTVEVSWPPIADPDILGYRIYWGERSEDYEDYIEVRRDGFVVDAGILTEVNCDTSFMCTIGGLDNDRRYYFNLTSYYESGVESDYQGEVDVLVEDTIGLAPPAGLSAAAGDAEVELSWLPVDGAESYRLYYGASPGTYGSYQDVGLDTAVILSGLTNGQTYYFAVTDFDDGGIESIYSGEVSATPAP